MGTLQFRSLVIMLWRRLNLQLLCLQATLLLLLLCPRSTASALHSAEPEPCHGPCDSASQAPKPPVQPEHQQDFLNTTAARHLLDQGGKPLSAKSLPTSGRRSNSSFVSSSTDCDVTQNGQCVQSVNFGSGNYDHMQSCIIRVTRNVAFSSTEFQTEANYDNLTYDGESYSGDSGPSGELSTGQSIVWSSDSSNTASGWQLCIAEQYGLHSEQHASHSEQHASHAEQHGSRTALGETIRRSSSGDATPEPSAAPTSQPSAAPTSQHQPRANCSFTTGQEISCESQTNVTCRCVCRPAVLPECGCLCCRYTCQTNCAAALQHSLPRRDW